MHYSFPFFKCRFWFSLELQFYTRTPVPDSFWVFPPSLPPCFSLSHFLAFFSFIFFLICLFSVFRKNNRHFWEVLQARVVDFPTTSLHWPPPLPEWAPPHQDYFSDLSLQAHAWITFFSEALLYLPYSSTIAPRWHYFSFFLPFLEVILRGLAICLAHHTYWLSEWKRLQGPFLKAAEVGISSQQPPCTVHHRKRKMCFIKEKNIFIVCILAQVTGLRKDS